MSDFQSSYSSSSSPSPILGTPHLDEAPLPSFEKDFFSNFSCCGLTLADMHDLLDHFEEAHVLVLGTDGKPVYPHFAANTSANSANAPPLASLAVGYPQPHPPAEPSAYTYTPPKHEHTYGYNYHGPDAGLGFGYPDLEEPYNPFGFDDYHGFTTGTHAPLPLPSSSSSSVAAPSQPYPYEQPPLLRINTSFPRSSVSSTTPSPTFTATTSSAPYSSAPSPLSVSSLPRSSASSAFSSPDLRPSRAEERCLPPALLSLPPQIARVSSFTAQQLQLQQTTSLPLIEPKPHGPPRTRTTAIEPYTLHPSISRRPSSSITSTTAPSHPTTSSNSPSPSNPTTIHTPQPQPHPQPTIGPHRTPTGRPSTASRRHKEGRTGRTGKVGREKAYGCPRAGCTKRYLNPNGLKYHLEKGTCVVEGGVGGVVGGLGGAGLGVGEGTIGGGLGGQGGQGVDVQVEVKMKGDSGDSEVAAEGEASGEVSVRDVQAQNEENEEQEKEEKEETDRWSSPIALPSVPPVPLSPMTLV